MVSQEATLSLGDRGSTASPVTLARRRSADKDIPPRVDNAIVNTTAISYRANRMIGGSAPSKYLAQIQGHAQVKLADPASLRADAFQDVYAARKAALLALIESAMGKVSAAATPVADDEDDEDEGEAA